MPNAPFRVHHRRGRRGHPGAAAISAVGRLGPFVVPDRSADVFCAWRIHISTGCSCRQAVHQDAQTFSSHTFAARMSWAEKLFSRACAARERRKKLRRSPCRSDGEGTTQWSRVRPMAGNTASTRNTPRGSVLFSCRCASETSASDAVADPCCGSGDPVPPGCHPGPSSNAPQIQLTKGL